MSRMTMEAFTHEQQVLALVLANAFPKSFESDARPAAYGGLGDAPRALGQ